ncbi:MAG: hypothetical protein P8013_08660 [Candidatus Sulfobium sp.]|jgi:hypothetical protein
MNSKAEEIRIRYLYRDLVLRNKIRLPIEGAVKIVGPDCAYHLYSVSEFRKDPPDSDPDGQPASRS